MCMRMLQDHNYCEPCMSVSHSIIRPSSDTVTAEELTRLVPASPTDMNVSSPALSGSSATESAAAGELLCHECIIHACTDTGISSGQKRPLASDEESSAKRSKSGVHVYCVCVCVFHSS